ASWVTSIGTRREDRSLHHRLILSQTSAGNSRETRLAPVFPGHALTGLSTARGSSRSGRCCIGLDVLEGTPVMENRPGDAGEFVGERNRQHVVVQPLFGGLDPRLEAIALPLLGPDLDQHDPG